VAKRHLLFSTTALTPLLIVLGGNAAMAQAVSAPNMTLGGFGGTWAGQGFGSAEGRWTAPIGAMTGAQVDAFAGVAGGQTFSQVAGHLFWRDPGTGLFGVYGAWTTQFGASTFRIGPEVELYSGNFTFSGVAGVKTGNGVSNGFAQAKLNMYLTPDTKVYVGAGYEDGGFISGGFEHQFASSGFSAFGEVRGMQGTTSAWLGLRYYFGAGLPKTLQAREREDVAPLWLHVTSQETSSVPSTTPTPSISGA
jgi:hypothetical protein